MRKKRDLGEVLGDGLETVGPLLHSDGAADVQHEHI